MKFNGPRRGFTPPAGYFPKTYTNITPAQLLDEYQRLSITNPTRRLYPNPKTHSIELRDTLWKTIQSKIENLLTH